jgi:hypothetical protein
VAVEAMEPSLMHLSASGNKDDKYNSECAINVKDNNMAAPQKSSTIVQPCQQNIGEPSLSRDCIFHASGKL